MSTYLVIATLLLSSCGTGSALIVNQNLNTTHVNLGSSNYRIVGNAVGTCQVEYILLIGGLNQRQIYQNAYSDMVSKAKLESGSRALVNVVTEEHIGGVPPFYFKRTITVSANVIEFTN